MKRVRVLCFVLIFIISASCVSFAVVPEVLPEKGNEIELQYVAASRVTPLLSISGGVADYSVTVIPKSSTSIGYIAEFSRGYISQAKSGNTTDWEEVTNKTLKRAQHDAAKVVYKFAKEVGII